MPYPWFGAAKSAIFTKSIIVLPIVARANSGARRSSSIGYTIHTAMALASLWITVVMGLP
jgi:hypothetical protein